MTTLRLLPTPAEMVAYLDVYVRGQHAAKRALCKAAYFHYLTITLPPDPSVRPSPEHCLLVGPTGSGKTLMVKSLANLLGVPVLFVNTASLTSEGYVGDSIGDILVRYARVCGGDPNRMSRGIIFLDEIDKIRAHGDDHADIRGTMVQQELLAVLDGNPLMPASKGRFEERYSVDTSKILFIGCGAFSGIDKITAARVQGLGFRQQPTKCRHREPGYAEVSAQDISSYGFLPEFTGRFSNIIPLQKLTKDELFQILSSSEQSPVTPYRRLFLLHDITLEFSPEALRNIAQKASGSEHGSRILRQLVSDCLSSVAWRIGELRDERVTGVIVDAETVTNGTDPKFVWGEPGYSSAALQVRQAVFELPQSPAADTPSEDLSQLTSGFEESASSLKISEISDCVNWSIEQIELRLDLVKVIIGYPASTEGARKWWDTFESENAERRKLVLRLAEEIAIRGSSITEYFLAYVYSDTENIQFNLEYLDFRQAHSGSGHTYGAGQLAGSGATQEEARRLLQYDLGEDAAQLVWRCIEKEAKGDGEALVSVALTLCREGLSSVDLVYEWALRCGTINPLAVLPFVRYFRGRSRIEVDQGRIAEELLPYWQVPERSVRGGGEGELLLRCGLLARIAEGTLWEGLTRRCGNLIEDSRDDEVVKMKRLARLYSSTSPFLREREGLVFTSTWREELERWKLAARQYPGERTGSFAIAWIEGIIAEIAPLLSQDPSWLTAEGVTELVSMCQSIVSYSDYQKS